MMTFMSYLNEKTNTEYNLISIPTGHGMGYFAYSTNSSLERIDKDDIEDLIREYKFHYTLIRVEMNNITIFDTNQS